MIDRKERVGAEIKRILAEPINEIAKDNGAGLATVVSVKMTKDLQIAKVYVSVIGGKLTPAEFLNVLEENSVELASLINSKIKLKRTPKLKFFKDEVLDAMEQTREIIEKVKKEVKNPDVNWSEYDENKLPDDKDK